MANLHFDLGVYASRERKILQTLDRLRCGIRDINQTLVNLHFKGFTTGLINVRRLYYGKGRTRPVSGSATKEHAAQGFRVSVGETVITAAYAAPRGGNPTATCAVTVYRADQTGGVTVDTGWDDAGSETLDP